MMEALKEIKARRETLDKRIAHHQTSLGIALEHAADQRAEIEKLQILAEHYDLVLRVATDDGRRYTLDEAEVELDGERDA